MIDQCASEQIAKGYMVRSDPAADPVPPFN